MILRKWEDLPAYMRTESVRPYYECIQKKKCSLQLKRIFDVIVSALMLLVLLPIMVIIGIAIKLDSEGPVFFRQIRVTQYGKEFRIWKFRTMINNAEHYGTQVTIGKDMRITHMGRLLRKGRLDELPQLINVFTGEMSFVGVRPEVPRYVAAYTDEMNATLLLPAGITSEASIRYKDEDTLLANASNADHVYIERILPEKMAWNLKGIREFSFWRDVMTMIRTVRAVFGKDY